MTTESARQSEAFEQGPVRGFLHKPEGSPRFAMVLTHGAGSNSDSPLLRSVASAFVEHGFAVLRFDLPFRQRRRTGPPHPSVAAQDRAGLLEAATVLKDLVDAPVILAGHSYGGRQASILATEQPSSCRALLLLSYPLHPPGKPLQLRTAHFANLITPALFVHGSEDPFATGEELRAAVAKIPAPIEISTVSGTGHDLSKGRIDLAKLVVEPLTQMLTQGASV